ncbi:unnamed protein product [Paramecium pentaurelia]|uniref:VIT domain-containing protein n=1 Tax=Paramecium pentaurelia TaxID=43138 RepID=A0A8S1U1I4_9CILI|nr:unnamed protein product [Paramecium pentaurelia]
MFHPNIDGYLHHDKSNFSEIQAPSLFICYDSKNKLQISLESVNYVLNVQSGLAIVEIQQNYNTQHYEVPIELEYMFTIQKDSVVSKMVAELGDIKVFGIVKELEEAKKEYQQGIQDGKTMIISQQDQKIPDLKQVKIGCLAPGKSLKITFEYIQPLKLYLNQFWMLELSPMVDSSYLTVYQLKNQSVNYPYLYKQIQQSVDIQGYQQNYRQYITTYINLQKPITFVKSPTHQIIINPDDHQQIKQNFTKGQVIILDDKFPDNFAPNKKFELLLSSNDINQPHSFLTHTNNDALQHIKYCATLTLIPKFNEVSLDDAYSSFLNGLNLPTEKKANRGNYYFLLIEVLQWKEKEQIKQNNHQIYSQKVYLKIVFLMLYHSEPNQQKCLKNPNNIISKPQMKQSHKQIKCTEIYEALKNGIYNDKDSKSDSETYNAFLLTDGEDSPNKILELVQNQTKPNFRIYTLGIGDGCSQYLLKKTAEIGNGKCQFVSDDEDINAKVMDLLENSMTQYLQGFKLDLPEINISQIIPDPEYITTIKKNEELLIQILFPTPVSETLEFQINCFDPQKQKQISHIYKVKISESQQQDYFHKLAAHKLINYYEDSLENNIKQINKIKINQEILNNEDIINLSISNQILCSKTAYICEVCHLEDEFKQLIKEKILYQNNKIKYGVIKFQTYQPNFYDLKSDSDQISPVDFPMKHICMDNFFSRDDIENEIMEEQMDMQYECELQSSFQNSQQSADLINYIDLLQCVQANGSFILEKRIADSIKLSCLTNDNHYEDILWTTIIALFYLELNCQNDIASWQLIYQKAINYLKKNGLDYLKIKTEFYNTYQKFFEVSN